MFRNAKERFFEVKPGLEMDTKKELEFLMHKFKQMSTGSVQARKNVFRADHLDVQGWFTEKKGRDARVIRIPRWSSKNVAEYSLNNGFWTLSEMHDSNWNLPFSRVVFLPNCDFLVIGGLNDQIVKKPAFSNQVV